MGFRSSTEDLETSTLNRQLSDGSYGSTKPDQRLLIYKDPLTIDDVYEMMGDTGVYQWISFFLLGTIAFLEADLIGMNFIGGSQDHWCHIETLSNLSYEHQKYIAIPTDSYGEYEKCRMYERNYSQYDEEDFRNWNRSLRTNDNLPVVDCTDGWTYDQSHYVNTISSRLDLVCGDQWMVSLISSMFLAGHLVGSVTSGFLSDAYGRKKTLYACVLLRLGATFMASFPFNFTWIAITRFLLGLGTSGAILTGFVLVLEQVNVTWRTRMIIFPMDIALGSIAWCVVAYFVRDDVKVQLVFGFSQLVLVTLPWLVDESPRWLLLKARYDEAESVVSKIATINNRQLPDDLDLTRIKQNEFKEEDCKSATWADVLRSSKLRLRVIILDLTWFAASLMYYAVSLNTGTLAGDVYLNTIMCGAVEIPANLAAIFFLNWSITGRRLTCALSLAIAGAVSVLSIYLLVQDFGTQYTVFSMVGKAFVTVGFSTIYIYTPELFPTEVRNVGIGTASLCGRIGGMVAPFIGGPLGAVWLPLPPLVCGTFAAVSGLLILLLPETLDQPLCNTLEEAEALGRPYGKCPSTRTSCTSPRH